MDEEVSMEYLGGDYFGPVDGNKQPHGFGMLTMPSGIKYSTEFVHGYAHGEGCFEPVEGGTVYCTWVKGLIEGRAEYYAPGGAVYERNYKNNKLISEKRIK